MAFIFKENDKDKKIEYDTIVANTDIILRNSVDLQRNLATLLEMITVTTWYVSDELLVMQDNYKDASIDHLRLISGLFGEYGNELGKMNTTIMQCMFLVCKYFNFDDESMVHVSERVRGDK